MVSTCRHRERRARCFGDPVAKSVFLTFKLTRLGLFFRKLHEVNLAWQPFSAKDHLSDSNAAKNRTSREQSLVTKTSVRASKTAQFVLEVSVVRKKRKLLWKCGDWEKKD